MIHRGYPPAMKERLIELLLECQALQFGKFVLKSGDLSPFFVDLGRVAQGGALADLGKILADAVATICPDVDAIFGPAYKGIVLGTAAAVGLSAHHNRSVGLLYDRKEAKSHGEGGMFVGHKPKVSQKVVIVDDVMSSGGTKIEGIRALREQFGVEPAAVLVTVDRTRQGFDYNALMLPFFSAILTIHDLADYLDSRDPAGAERMRAFWRGE